MPGLLLNIAGHLLYCIYIYVCGLIQNTNGVYIYVEYFATWRLDIIIIINMNNYIIHIKVVKIWLIIQTPTTTTKVINFFFIYDSSRRIFIWFGDDLEKKNFSTNRWLCFFFKANFIKFASPPSLWFLDC